ncbi:MAG: UPF0149 family protein [Rubrivivax sp.]|nr:UPF0149 family protein [Rubrivivax sp.]
MRDLSDTELARLQALLDELAAAAPRHSPLDVSALDGFLCAVLLQPRPLPKARWWPFVADAEGRTLPATAAAAAPALRQALAAVEALVDRRHAVLAAALTARRWFDPWIFELDADEDRGANDDGGEGGGGSSSSKGGNDDDGAAPAAVRDSVLPWVGGFALAAEQFPALLQHDALALAEPLALLYQHFDAADLEGLDDEPQLATALAEIEPPADLTEAAEDLVRAVLLLADVNRPAPGPAAARTGPGHASPAPGPRSRTGRPARVRRG